MFGNAPGSRLLRVGSRHACRLIPLSSAEIPQLKLKASQKVLWIHGWYHLFPSHEGVIPFTEFIEAIDAPCDNKRALSVKLIASLKSCSLQKNLSDGCRLHAEIRAHGLLDNNISLGNMLLTMYTKCNALLEAQEVFNELPDRDVVSWNVLIAGYNKSGQGRKALACHDWMRREGISPDSITYACILKACGITKQAVRGKQIHDEIVNRGLLGSNVMMGNALVDMYAKCGILSKAQKVLDELPVRDVISWNTLIAGYVQCGQCKEAMHQYQQMQKVCVSPDAFTYACILKAFGTSNEIDKGRQIHSEIVSKGLLEISDVLGNALVDMYAKSDVLYEAQKVLDELPIRDVVSWSALIAGYSQKGRGKEALDCYERMQNEGLSPDAVTFSCVLRACGVLGWIDRGKEIHNEIVKQGLLKRNVVLGTALVYMYCKCGLLSVAALVLDGLAVRNVVSWSALITGYAQQGHGEEALDCFQRMRNEGMHPDAITYASILKACGITNDARRGKQIHDEVVSQGMLGNNVVLGTALVDMYAKCGVLMKATQVLEELSIRNVVSWNALVAGYAQQGKGQEALDCFKRMRSEGLTPNRSSWNAVIGGYAQQGQVEEALGCYHWMQREGISPDSITFVNMLNACTHSGLVDEGQTYFENMRKDHGIIPDLEHHTCMIGLYARAGHFDKAMALVNKLPSSDYPPIWSALLGACQKWGNLKLGRLAFEHAVQLDEGDAVAYVYMESICAAAGVHEGAQQIAAMRLKNTCWLSTGSRQSL